MNYCVERSPRAWRDLEEIADYIAQNNLDAALRFYDAAEAAFVALAQMPYMGVASTFEQSRLGTVRILPVPHFENWLIFYRPIEKGVEIIRVIHGSRDVRGLFADEESP